MKTILFAPTTLNLSETSRQIEIAKAVDGTFKPEFISYGGDFEHLIEDAGFSTQRLTPRFTPEQIELLYKMDRLETSKHPFTQDFLVERVENEIRVLEALQPTAVSTGGNLTTLISCRAVGIPLVVTMPFAMSRPFYQAGLGTWPDAFDYAPLRMLPARFLNWLMTQIMLKGKFLVKDFNKVGQKFGVPPIELTTDLFQGDYTLVSDIPFVTGVQKLPSNHRYIGPLFAKFDMDIPPEIQHLPQDLPIIYFAMGSSGNAKIVQQILAGFEGKPYRVIAPIKQLLANSNVTIPDNVLVTDLIPAHKVNPLADISVIHGGQGTVQTACLSGTPIVGVPMQPEQEGNLDFLARLGCAIHIRKRRVSAEAVLQAVDQLLADKHAKQQAKTVQHAYQQWDGVQNAFEFFVEKFLVP